MSDRRYHILFNARSGAALGEALTPTSLQASFARSGLSADLDADPDEPLAARIAAAKAGPADIIVAAGGDGTVTALARALVGTDKTLALLPLGTANLLARDLGIPLALGEAIAGLSAMHIRRIDVGVLNGQIFLHKAVVGFAPEIAAGREKLRERGDFAAKLRFASFFIRRVMRPRSLTIDIVLGDGRRMRERVRSVAVANNSYDEAMGRVFARRRLDRGCLSLYVLKRLDLLDLLRLSAGMLLGNWRGHEALTIETASAVDLISRQRGLQVMIDGEVDLFAPPLSFRIRPAALAVLAPERGEGQDG